MSKSKLRGEIERLERQVANLKVQRDALQAAVVFYGAEEGYPEYYASARSSVLHDGGLIARGSLLRALEVQAVEDARSEFEAQMIQAQRIFDAFVGR